MNQEKLEQRLKQIRNVAVYCGSHDGSDPEINAAVVAFGQFLAAHKMTLIFGGSNVGTMKLLADTVLENGGRVIGIFTKNFPAKQLHSGLTENFVAANLAERKAEMLKRADVVVALPGSYGTWDELFDALALRKISSGGHKRPVGILNVNGYFDDLLKFIHHSVEVGFTAPRYAGLLKSGKTPDELFGKLTGALPPPLQ
ncbi:MAG: TIGR00730 family Rossman fold protein [Victivallaceae bacterium]|nr:TIGR00730 family Rossman fold protein [Victivallaceae bacterium]